MLKKIITGTLVLIVLSTSSVVVYADNEDKLYIDEKLKMESQVLDEKVEDQKTEEKKETEIKIISPQIISDKEIITEKNLLISIKVIGEDTVTLSVYKLQDDAEEAELLFDPEEIEPSDEVESDYVKYVKNIESGKYRMVFEQDGKEEPIEEIEFDVKSTKVKKKDEVVSEEVEDSLPNLLDLKITDLLLGDE
ncbi:hypothetical protein R9X47_15540 [Wukongibacter baidiensis]|uniref:hypothetical protein n=1 Tax=Wukongibacter baidiensis TaxID=1723361 RepID=UPI003D7F1F09